MVIKKQNMYVQYRKDLKIMKKKQIRCFLEPAWLCYTPLPFEAIESLGIIILTKKYIKMWNEREIPLIKFHAELQEEFQIPTLVST